MKVCSKCHKQKDKTEFYEQQANQKTSICMECQKQDARIRYRKKNPTFKRRGRQSPNLLNKKYGLLTVIQRVEKNESNKSGWLCRCECGNKRIVVTCELNRGRAKSCGCLTYKERPDRTHTGIKKHDGYISLYRPKHPNATKDGWIAEHTLIMSKKIARPLKKDEQIHHKNGIKDDNRIGNLELWTIRHPSGQRVEDMVKFCISYLKDYEPNILAIN
ncbi:MAG: hypothetical protein E3J56_14745 [Candidatus Aminicenantes bacterium]|nr:MAG: hypothetical protein E3J56_14745 [Candidatus Aminicenantes bacterium]